MLEFLPYIISCLVFITPGIVSLFLYQQTRKMGYLFIGLGFLLGAIPTLVNLALGGPYLHIKLQELGYTMAQISAFLFELMILNVSLQATFALFVLVGLVQFMREIKA